MDNTINAHSSQGIAAQYLARHNTETKPLGDFKTLVEGNKNEVATPLAEQVKNFESLKVKLEHDMKQHERDMHKTNLDIAKRMLAYWEQNSPDSSSDIRTVFSVGNKVLAYVDDNGYLVTHEGAGNLRRIAIAADELGLTGESRVKYMEREVEKALNTRYPTMQMDQYDKNDMPTKRAFNAKWYPDHNTDAAYNKRLAEARADLYRAEAMYNGYLAQNDMA